MPTLPTSLEIENLHSRVTTTYYTLKETYTALYNTHCVAVIAHRELERLKQSYERILNDYKNSLDDLENISLKNLSLHSKIDDLQKEIEEDDSLKKEYCASIRDMGYKNIALQKEVDVLKEQIAESESVKLLKEELEAELAHEKWKSTQAENERRIAKSEAVNLAKEILLLRNEVDPNTAAGKRVNQLEASRNRELARVALMEQQMDKIAGEKEAAIKMLEEERARMAEVAIEREEKIGYLERLARGLTQNPGNGDAPSLRLPKRRDLQRRRNLSRECKGTALGQRH